MPQIKKEEYQVRVHIIECRDIKGLDKNGMSDPVVYVDCLGESQQTEIFEDTSQCTIDHLMFFTYKINPDEFKQGKIQIRVFDANTIYRNELIGSFDLDLQFVRNQKGHEVFRRWVAITDPTGTRKGIQGYVRLSAVVLGAGETAPGHTEAEEEDDIGGDSLQSMILVPPEIKIDYKQLKVRVYKAKDLPKMDSFGRGSDAFVQVKFAGATVKTKVLNNSENPTWNQELIIPFSMPTMSDQIEVLLYDHDSDSKDDLIATTRLSLNTQLPFGPQWVTLYGAPGSGTSKEHLAMNSGAVAGSTYRGRLLLGMEMTDAPAGGGGLGAAGCAAATEAKKVNYTLRVDVMEASAVPHDDQLCIGIANGAEEWKTDYAKCEGGHVLWYAQMKPITLTRADDLSLVPDIIVNIYEKETIGGPSRIGYRRIKAADIFDPNPKTGGDPHARWRLLHPDNFNGDMKKEEIAGSVSIRLWLGRADAMEKAERQPLLRPTIVGYQLRAHIYQARGLPSSDESGVADAYAVVHAGSVNAKTRVKEGTLCPQWYESLKLDCELPSPLDRAPDVAIMVYDHDEVTRDDYIGRFTVPVVDLTAKMPKKPKWYALGVGDDEFPKSEPFGAVLASFQLIPAVKAAKTPTKLIKPAFKPCWLRVQMVGARSLQSRLLLPVNKPFIEIDCGDKKRAVKTKATDQPHATNPNYLTVLELEVDLPDDPLFAPPINIRVYDDRALHNVLLGTRSLQMSQFMPSVPVEERRETARAQLSKKAMPKAVEKIDGGNPEDSVEAVKKELKQLEKQAETGAASVDYISKRVAAAKKMADVTGEHKIHDLEKGKAHEISLEAGAGNNDAKIDELEKGRTLPNVDPISLPGLEAEGNDGDAKASGTAQDRSSVDAELELSLDQLPYGVYALYRAKKLKAKFGRTRHELVPVGDLKCQFEVFLSKEEKKKAPLPDLKRLFAPSKWVVRAYVLRGYQMVPPDDDGKCDPFMIVTCGEQVKKSKNDTVNQNTLRPTFYELFQFDATFPRDGRLSLNVMDQDKLKDDLIGKTEIDLENRIMSKQWLGMKEKPREFRAVWNPSSSCPQGQLELWVDILTPAEAAKTPPIEIAPPSRQDFELRVVVWNVKDAIFRDTSRLMNDIFVSGSLRGQKAQTTDTHWRSEDGKGEFNWRMVWPISLPMKNPNLTMLLWDKDVLNPNDSVCESVINLTGLCRKAFNAKTTQKVERQWIEMLHPNYGKKPQGKLELSMQLLTATDALAKPVGLGRDEPNQFPTLPAPNRPETSFNPFALHKVFYHLVWKKYKPYVIAGCVCIALCFLLLLLIAI